MSRVGGKGGREAGRQGDMGGRKPLAHRHLPTTVMGTEGIPKAARNMSRSEGLVHSKGTTQVMIDGER